MNWTILICLASLSTLFLLIEMRGIRTTLQLRFKGDIQRESLFLAQYGQSVATPIAAWLIAIAEGQGVFLLQLRVFTLVCVPVAITSLTCSFLKRVLGRMRPNREHAGRFTGPAWKRDNKRESFPSSHSACAFALTVTLIHFFPEAAIVFWLLASSTAVLRYLLDAHFPSDILAGVLLGLLIGHYGLSWMEHLWPVA